MHFMLLLRECLKASNWESCYTTARWWNAYWRDQRSAHHFNAICMFYNIFPLMKSVFRRSLRWQRNKAIDSGRLVSEPRDLSNIFRGLSILPFMMIDIILDRMRIKAAKFSLMVIISLTSGQIIPTTLTLLWQTLQIHLQGTNGNRERICWRYCLLC